MHLVIPFAAPASVAGRAALAALPEGQWPRLTSMLGRMHCVERDEGDELSLSPPHERVLARALGWSEGGRVADGRLPWAARLARSDGVDPGTQAWGLVTPAHWHVGTDQVSLADPKALALDEPQSRALFEVLQELFAGAGFRLVFGAATRWYAAHECLRDLRTASLDRVIGRNVDRWLDADPGAGPVRRLQSEAQMLLHEHPLNQAREARGLLPVNSFWLSGCGLALVEPEQAPSVDDRLRAPALAEEWAAWAECWVALEDSTLMGLDAAMRRGAQVCLTLCGERSAVSFAPSRGGFVRRVRSLVRRPLPRALLESL